MKVKTLAKKIIFITSAGLASAYITSCSAPPAAGSFSPAYSDSVNSQNSVSSIVTAGNRAKITPAKTSQVPIERPGLGTSWGEDVVSSVTFTNFQRAQAQPHSVSSIYYNDQEGIKAMTRSWTYRGKGLQKAANGMVEWGVKGNWGYLKNKHSNGKRFVTGRKNQTYSLVVKNICKSRLEIIMSVDGLDVLDGKTASTKKRGYIIQPGKTLVVKGFRKSSDAVAAFKFASVNSSYSNLSGKGTRNVGVIGMAVFTEKGIDPWTYTPNEIRNRTSARAFAEAPQLRAR